MPNRPWTTFTAQSGSWFVLMSLVMGWLSRRPHAPGAAGEANGDAVSARHPDPRHRVLRILRRPRRAVVPVPRQDGIADSSRSSFLGFALLGVPMILEYHRVRHEVVAGGLSYQTMLREARADDVGRGPAAPRSESSKGFRVSRHARRDRAYLRDADGAARVRARRARRRAAPVRGSDRAAGPRGDGRRSPPSIWGKRRRVALHRRSPSSFGPAPSIASPFAPGSTLTARRGEGLLRSHLRRRGTRVRHRRASRSGSSIRSRVP
mgnify:CR=1 FL=1